MLAGLLRNFRTSQTVPALAPVARNIQGSINILKKDVALIPYQSWQLAEFSCDTSNHVVSYAQQFGQSSVDVRGPEVVYFWDKLKKCFGQKGDKKKGGKKTKKQSCKKKKCGKQKATCLKKKDSCEKSGEKKDLCQLGGKKEEKKKEDSCKKTDVKKADGDKKDPCKKEKKEDPCKKKEEKKDPCKKNVKKEDPCKKKEEKKDPCKKKEEKKEDPCKKKEAKKEDPCKKKEEKKEDPCKKKEEKKEDPCKKKEDPCKKKEEKKEDPCKKKEDPCKKKEEKKEDPCKKKEDPCKKKEEKKEDPCKKKEDPCKKKEEKKEDPCKKKEDPCKKKEEKKEDPCKKKEDPCKKGEKKEDPCKKKEDPCKKKEDPCKKKEDPCKKDKKEDPCEPCKKKEDSCKKKDPCAKIVGDSSLPGEPVVLFSVTNERFVKDEEKCSKPCKDPCAEGACDVQPGLDEPCRAAASWKIKVRPCRQSSSYSSNKTAPPPSGPCIIDKVETLEQKLEPDDQCGLTKHPCGKKVCPNKCEIKRKTKFSGLQEEPKVAVQSLLDVLSYNTRLFQSSYVNFADSRRSVPPSGRIPDSRRPAGQEVPGTTPPGQNYTEKVSELLGKLKGLWQGPGARPEETNKPIRSDKPKRYFEGIDALEDPLESPTEPPCLDRLTVGKDFHMLLMTDDFENCEDRLPPCPLEPESLPCPATAEGCVKTTDDVWSDIDANWAYEKFPWKLDAVKDEKLDEVSLRSDDPYANHKL